MKLHKNHLHRRHTEKEQRAAAIQNNNNKPPPNRIKINQTSTAVYAKKDM